MELKKLDEVLKVVRGSSPRPIKSYITESEEGVNWIKIGDANENDKYITSTKEKITKLGAGKSRFVDVGDFIFSNSMSFGRAYIMKISGYIHDGWFTFKLPQTLDQNYLWYLFRSPFLKDQINTLASGAIVQNISSDLVKKCILPIPPLSEQQAIVEKLDAAFALIDQAKANIEKNIQNAKELFQSKLNQIFSQKGEGWEERKLGEVCENLDSKRIPITKNRRSSGEIPYYGASGIVDFVDNYIFDGDYLLVSEDGANLIMRTYPIAFSVSGKIWVNNHAHILKFNNINTQKYFEYYLNSIKLDDYISGMAQPKLNQAKLNLISIPLPTSLETQQQIVLQLDALSQQTNLLQEKYRQKLQNLEELRKSILEKAFKGELVQMSESQISSD